jgi:hypothetical protein
MVEHVVIQSEIVTTQDTEGQVMIHSAKTQVATMMKSKESLLVGTTVELSDNLVDNFDVICGLEEVLYILNVLFEVQTHRNSERETLSNPLEALDELAEGH